MSNLKPAPLFLTPQVVDDVMGIGRAKRMADLPIVSLDDTGARCSRLRLNILREVRSQSGVNNQFVPQREVIAAILRIPTKAVDEHVAALRKCGCLHPSHWQLRLTAKGHQKLAMDDFAAKQEGRQS